MMAAGISNLYGPGWASNKADAQQYLGPYFEAMTNAKPGDDAYSPIRSESPLLQPVATKIMA